MLDAFEPETVMKALSGEKEGNSPTVLMAVPTMYSRLLSFLVVASKSFLACLKPVDLQHISDPA